jgi:hypothetical protein
MKKIITLFAVILLVAGATAQKVSYSAVVRNSDNVLQADKNLTVMVSIANSLTDEPVYTEIHTAQTNQNGLLSLTIGDGTNKTGDMHDVTWPTAFITTDITLPGDAHVINTIPVNAVPYALYGDTFSPEAVLEAVGKMSDTQKAALLQALGLTPDNGN